MINCVVLFQWTRVTKACIARMGPTVSLREILGGWLAVLATGIDNGLEIYALPHLSAS